MYTTGGDQSDAIPGNVTVIRGPGCVAELNDIRFSGPPINKKAKPRIEFGQDFDFYVPELERLSSSNGFCFIQRYNLKENCKMNSYADQV